MQATAEPNATDKSNIKTRIAIKLGVDESAGMKNFDVGFAAARRRRQLLVAGTWTVSFDFVTDTSNSAASVSAVAGLDDPDFQVEVKASVPSIASFYTAQGVIQTRKPSAAPSPFPTAVCSSGYKFVAESHACESCSGGRHAIQNSIPPWTTECTVCQAGNSPLRSPRRARYES
jgi:hypothetical protein